MRGSSPTVGSSRNSTCGSESERAGDLEPPALAAAVGRDGSVERGRSSPNAVGERARCGRRRRRASTPHSRAWIWRLRRPVRARSTTASWKTTALAARAAIGLVGHVVPVEQAPSRGGLHRGGEHADGRRLARRRSDRAGRRPRRARRRSRSLSPPRRPPARSCGARGRRWSPDGVGAGGRSSPPPTHQPAEV